MGKWLLDWIGDRNKINLAILKGWCVGRNARESDAIMVPAKSE